MNERRGLIVIPGTAACLLVVLAVGGCSTGAPEDLTSTRPYADLIGLKYSVVSDELYAYGVYDSADNRTLKYVTLVPRDLSGPEFAFRKKIPKGQTIRILRAWRHFILLDSGVYYEVELEGADLPAAVPIRLGLSRGNAGQGADLNPAVYTKLNAQAPTGAMK